MTTQQERTKRSGHKVMDDNSLATIHERLAAHERDIINLTQAVSSLSETLKSNAEAHWKAIRDQGDELRLAISHQGDEVRKDISVIGQQLSDSKAVNWPLIVSVGGGGITVAALAVTVLTVLWNMALDPIKSQLDRHMLDGHPVSLERELSNDMATMQQDIGRLATRLDHQDETMHNNNQIRWSVINLTRKEVGLEPIDLQPVISH